MRVKETTRKEIEQRFLEMNDYLKMEYLKNCLKNQLDFDTKKFVLVKLVGLYEAKGMLLEAGRMMKSAGEINTSIASKVADFIKAAELFIRGGDFESADAIKKKAVAIAPLDQQAEIERRIREYYKIQAKIYVDGSKRKQAAGFYEKLLTMELGFMEKREIQEELLKVYEGLGDFNKYRNLRRKVFNE